MSLAGTCFQPLGIIIVGRDQCRAARQQAFKDLRLGVGNGLATAEEFQMRGRDGGDQRHMRFDKADQVPQLAEMIHPHFKNAVLTVARHGGKA